MTWAVHDGDVPPIMLALRSFKGGERLHGAGVDPHGVWRGTRTMSRDGSGEMGGEGRDWIELMTRTRPRKEDVI